jgi:dienelactone hydrolase
MQKHSIISFFSIVLFSALLSCNSETKKPTLADPSPAAPVIKTQTLNYALDTVQMNGFIAYDESFKTRRPVVLIVHEWWGLNDYARSRASKLAELGYLAFAIDLYGNGTTADNPELAGKLAGPFYQDPGMAKKRFDAALQTIRLNELADTTRIAAIGYCFGGAQVINMAKLGNHLAGVVSFHGNLNVVPTDKALLHTPILVCHGADDKFVPETEVAIFKKQMDSIGASYTFKSYAGATHAFTNPGATAMGQKFSIPIAYNAAADSASWNDMKTFFGTIFK